MRSISERGLVIVYSTVNFVYQRSYSDFERDVQRGTKWPHYFCGKNTVRDADCPNCNKPLTLLLKVNTADPNVEELSALGIEVPLLYCFRCALSEGLFYYQCQSSSVRVLEYVSGAESEEQPYPGFPSEFAGCPAYLLELSPEAQIAITRLNRRDIDSAALPYFMQPLRLPLHQLGGEPLLMNTYHESVPCVNCGAPMKFLASIADECLHPIGFTGDAGSQVMFHCCLSCRVISAFAQSD